MIVKKTSILTGKNHTMDLDVTQEQLNEFENGGDVNQIFANLDQNQRDFISTGVTPEEKNDQLGTPRYKELFG